MKNRLVLLASTALFAFAASQAHAQDASTTAAAGTGVTANGPASDVPADAADREAVL